MASAVGHGLSAYWIYSVLRNRWNIDPFKGKFGVILIIFIAILPDLDVLLLIMSNSLNLSTVFYHRGFSHSLLFGLIASLFIGYITHFYTRLNYLKIVLMVISIFYIHYLLDYLMGAGPPVKFFAPLYNKGFLSSVKFIPTAHYSSSASGMIGVLFSFKTWAGIILEFMIFLPLIISANLEKLRTVPFVDPIKKYYLYSMSVFGVLATVVLYELGLGGYIIERFLQ